jgi:hypothetical protein
MSETRKHVFVIGPAAAKTNRRGGITVPSTAVPVELLRKYSSPKPTLPPRPTHGRKSA